MLGFLQHPYCSYPVQQFIRTGLSILLGSVVLYGGVGGKLAGTVTSEDNVPLPGVNIVIEGTDLGAASNENGQYYVLNIPPGYYTVRFMMIGYKTVVQERVLIQSDFTTQVDVVLEQTVLQAEKEVIVTAKRPLIQRDATSSVRVVGAEEIVDMPVVDFKGVLATQAGFTVDPAGGLHVRGGRTKEILYMIDGVEVQDPLGGEFTGTVNQNAIQEMTVISGTFNAEYGDAMSSVVNIVTKEGRDDFRGRVEFISDQLNASPYHQPGAFKYLDTSYATVDSLYQYVDLRDSLFTYLDGNADVVNKPLIPLLDLPLSGSMSLTASGRLPFPRTHYFVAGLYSTYDSPLPHGVDINQDIQVKVTSRLVPKIKLTAHLQSTNHLYQRYSHSWKYRPTHQAYTFRSNDRLALTFTHTLSKAFYYSFYLSQQETATFRGVQDKQPIYELPNHYQEARTDEMVYFYDHGDQGVYTNNQSTTKEIKFNTTYQANQHHLLKSGFTLTNYHLKTFSVQNPWPGGTNLWDSGTFEPTEASFYVQDKIEFNFLILNLGLRYDRLDPNAGMWADISQPFSWDSTTSSWVPSPLVDVPPVGKWSPRIGIAYPVTDRTVFHFSYGHFFQNPSYDALYLNAQKDIGATLALVGNPAVKPQKTVAFETGLRQALSSDLALELTVWSKDIRDLLSTYEIRHLANPYVIFTNTDYASVKGVDFSIQKRFGGYLSGSFNYSLSVAKGNNSNPISGYFSAYTEEEVPHQEYYLDFDQRHDIALNLSIRIPRKVGPSLGSFYPLSRLNGNILVNAGSGLPYTPYVDPTFRVIPNSARKPWTLTVDLRLKKYVDWDPLQLTIFLEVLNLTDYENVLYVYSRTGDPFDPGFAGVGTSLDANLNPAHIGPRRSVKLGLDIDW